MNIDRPARGRSRALPRRMAVRAEKAMLVVGAGDEGEAQAGESASAPGAIAGTSDRTERGAGGEPVEVVAIGLAAHVDIWTEWASSGRAIACPCWRRRVMPASSASSQRTAIGMGGIPPSVAGSRASRVQARSGRAGIAGSHAERERISRGQVRRKRSRSHGVWAKVGRSRRRLPRRRRPPRRRTGSGRADQSRHVQATRSRKHRRSPRDPTTTRYETLPLRRSSTNRHRPGAELNNRLMVPDE